LLWAKQWNELLQLPLGGAGRGKPGNEGEQQPSREAQKRSLCPCTV